MSQQEFATQLGISIRGLVNYEKDRRPSTVALARLERLAGVSGHADMAEVFRRELHLKLYGFYICA